MAKFKKIMIPALALATIFTATGCSNPQVDRANALQQNLLAEAVRNEEGIQDFRLIGTDVEKIGFEFDVNMNGVAKLDDGSQAFTSFTYSVPSTYFTDLKKMSSANAVYDVLDRVVEDLDYTVCTINPVKNIKEVNRSFVHNAPSPFERYDINKAVVYNLSLPTFNDEAKEISFDVKTLMNLRKTKLVGDWGLGFNLSYGIGFFPGTGRGFVFGYGVTIRSCEGTFVTDDTYKFTVDEQTYDQMKQDNSLVYTYVTEAINECDNSKISADRNTTNYVTYDAADLLSYFDMNKVADEYSL